MIEVHQLSITVEAARFDDRILITWPELELAVHGETIPSALHNMADAVEEMAWDHLRKAVLEHRAAMEKKGQAG